MPRPVTYIPYLTNKQIRDLACGNDREFHRIYNQVQRVHNKSFSEAVKVAQKKYREKKKLQDPNYLEKNRKIVKDYYLRHPEKKEQLRLYNQKFYQKKKLEKLQKLNNETEVPL